RLAWLKVELPQGFDQQRTHGTLLRVSIDEDETIVLRDLVHLKSSYLCHCREHGCYNTVMEELAMTLDPGFANGTTSVLVVVSPEPPGRFTAKVVAVPEIHATSTTREEAIQSVRTQLSEWLTSGNLVSVAVPVGNPWLQLAGH